MKNNSLADEIRNIAKHTNRDTVETLRAKLQQIEAIDNDERLRYQVDADTRSVLVRSQEHLRTRIYRVIITARGECW